MKLQVTTHLIMFGNLLDLHCIFRFKKLYVAVSIKDKPFCAYQVLLMG